MPSPSASREPTFGFARTAYPCFPTASQDLDPGTRVPHDSNSSDVEAPAPDNAVDLAKGGPRVVFAWPDFEPDNLFAGLTASRLALAAALAARGSEVVMAWVGRPGADGEGQLRDWVAGRGMGTITFEAVPESCRPSFPWRMRWARSFDFHDWLRAFGRDHSVASVNCPDTAGVAYYALLARRGGLDYGDVRFVVEVSGPLRRLRALGHRTIEDLEDLYEDFLERRCIELADALVVPDASVPAWLSGHGWPLPGDVSVVAPAVDVTRVAPCAKPASRVVFVGQLAMEGYLPLVCRTLDRDHVQARLRDKEVVFWGPAERIRSRSALTHIEACATRWRFPWRVESDLSTRGAEKLFGDGRGVAIFPAGRTAAWMPRQWCLDSGIACAEPHGAPDMPGGKPGPMHMDAADLRRLEPVRDPDAIERALDVVLADPAVPRERPPGPREPRIEARVRGMLQPAATPAAIAGRAGPLVSVCIVTRNRPKLLPQALASIEAQDYPNIEVVLVDDGSTLKGALALLDQLEPRFLAKGWRLLRQERTFHAAARNRAVREARGDWVMLFDDDCVSEPHQVRTMLKFATSIGADIVTSPRHVFVGDHTPTTGDRTGYIWAPLGAVPTAGLFENCLGDTNLLIRRETFLKLGGLRTDFGVPAADREFLIRATSSSLRMEVIPQVLYHYRVTEGSVSRGLTPESEALRGLRFARPFVEALPPALVDLPCVAANWMHRCQHAEKELAKSHDRIAMLKERLKTGDARSAGEIRIRLTPDSIRGWLVRLGRSIKKRIWGRSPGRRP